MAEIIRRCRRLGQLVLVAREQDIKRGHCFALHERVFGRDQGHQHMEPQTAIQTKIRAVFQRAAQVCE